jgi:aminomethyltransferase
VAVWDALAERDVRPAGLGARDTLRLEVCFHLYGNDLSEDRNPIEAGLGWCCKRDTGFLGAEALAAVEPDQKLVPFAFTGPGIPRQDNPVGAPHGSGVVTSGTLSPCLEIGIGMAYVPVADAEPGTPIEVDVRGKARPAEVREKPLYRKADSG